METFLSGNFKFFFKDFKLIISLLSPRLYLNSAWMQIPTDGSEQALTHQNL